MKATTALLLACALLAAAATALPGAEANRARRTLLQDDGAGASANATAPAANATGAANATAKAPATLAAALAPAKANNLSTLVAAVEAANLTAPLANASTAWTIFAPNDAAFENLAAELGVAPAALLANESLLAETLSYHVVPSAALTSDQLADGEALPTLLAGRSVTVSKPPLPSPAAPTGLAVFNADCKAAVCPPAANVVARDVRVGKSVVHVIDRVLSPVL